MSTEESILERNKGLFQEHPMKEMYIKDKEAIIFGSYNYYTYLC